MIYRIPEMKNMHFFRKGMPFLAMALLLVSCLSIKPATVKSPKKLYESFFLGNGKTQYFIKPLEFTAGRNDVIRLDFTLRDTPTDTNVTVNFSVYAPEAIDTVHALRIQADRFGISSDKVQQLFRKKHKKNYESRFSTEFPVSAIQKAFARPNWHVVVEAPKGKRNYPSARRAQRKVRTLHEAVFQLLKYH